MTETLTVHPQILNYYNYNVICNYCFEEPEPVIQNAYTYEENGVYYCASATQKGVYWYIYARNCPLMYTDPDGENPILIALIVGAVINAVTYTVSAAVAPGGLSQNWNAGQFIFSVGMGAMSGAMTAGIGAAFGPVGSMGIWGELGRAGAHAVSSGIFSKASGGTFWQGALSGGLSSIAGSAFMMYGGQFANSPIGTYAFSAVAGGVGSKIAGGTFWQGAVTGLMNAGLNHLAQTIARPSFEDLLANFPMNENGGEMPAGDVYELIGGKVLSEHLRDPESYNNACALRVSRALNGSGVDLPNIPGKTLKGDDGRNYFYRAQDLYNWMTQSYGKPNHSTQNYLSLDGNKGIYIMQANYPARFGAWGHATLYNMTGTIGNSYAGSYAYRYYLWGF